MEIAARDPSTERGALAGLLVLGGALLALCAVMLRCLDDDGERFAWLAFAQGAVYGLAIWLVLRRMWSPRALYVVIAVALLARAVALPAPPILSTDVYRYVWDGRVQAAGINPYRYIPSDAVLAPLRDEEIYPNINRIDSAPTIYPPAAQMIFLAVSRLSETLTAMKLAMFGFDIVTIIAIVALLRREGRPLERVLIYAWHPLPIWEFAGTGHVDAAAIALMCLAVLATASGRRLVAGAALAASALVKPFTLVISPALWRKWDWRMPLAFAATLLACYLPYLGVGSGVFGYLGGYGDEEGYNDGVGFFLVALLRALGLPSPTGLAFGLLALAILAALAVTVVLRRSSQSVESAAPILLGSSFFLLMSPHYPWYFAWVLPFLCRTVYLPLLYVTLASFVFYLPGIVGAGAYFKGGMVLYGGFGLLAAIDLRSRINALPMRRFA